MPFAHLKVGLPDDQQPVPAAELSKTITRLTAEILHKKPEVTAVQVERVPAAGWFIADRTLAEHGKASFNLRISITEGTNTKDEKALYVAAVFEALGKTLGALHPASYVLVDEVHGDAYGYGGLTQEHRYVAAQIRG